MLPQKQNKFYIPPKHTQMYAPPKTKQHEIYTQTTRELWRIKMTVSQTQGNPFYYTGYTAPNTNSTVYADFQNEVLLLQQLNQNNSIFANNPAGVYQYPTGTLPIAPQNQNQNPVTINQEGTLPEIQAPKEDEPDFFEGLGKVVVSPLKTSWELIKSGGQYIADTAKGAWKGTFGALGTLFSGHPIDAICEVFEGAWDVFKAPFKLVGNVATDIWNGAKDIFSGIGEMFSSIF